MRRLNINLNSIIWDAIDHPRTPCCPRRTWYDQILGPLDGIFQRLP